MITNVENANGSTWNGVHRSWAIPSRPCQRLCPKRLPNPVAKAVSEQCRVSPVHMRFVASLRDICEIIPAIAILFGHVVMFEDRDEAIYISVSLEWPSRGGVPYCRSFLEHSTHMHAQDRK